MFSHPEMRNLLTALSTAAPVTSLAPVTALTTALALATEAGDIDRLRDIASTATALQTGARARGMGLDAENQAAEVVLRAERAIGSILLRMAEDGTRAGVGRNTHDGAIATIPSLLAGEASALMTPAEQNVLRASASRWQALARIPEVEFESRFGTVRDSGARLAKVDFYRMVGKPKAAAKPEAEREMHGDGYSSTYSAFAKANADLIAEIEQLPADELLALAGDIRSLVNAYNAVRASR